VSEENGPGAYFDSEPVPEAGSRTAPSVLARANRVFGNPWEISRGETRKFQIFQREFQGLRPSFE